jgi:hypothetical protein
MREVLDLRFSSVPNWSEQRLGFGACCHEFVIYGPKP